MKLELVRRVIERGRSNLKKERNAKQYGLKQIKGNRATLHFIEKLPYQEQRVQVTKIPQTYAMVLV